MTKSPTDAQRAALEQAANLPEIPVKVASLSDLACMKLAAISKRGAARDFWDLFVILRRHEEGLKSLLDTFARKHPRMDIGHVVRSLAYFDDAESDPRPRGMTDGQWKQIRADIETRVREL